MTALESLSFLLGEWQAISGPGEPAGGFTFALQALGRVMVRTNYADYPATAERPAFRHEDLMVIYIENGALRGDFFDSEGHIIRYAGAVGRMGEVGAVVFASLPPSEGLPPPGGDPAPGSPAFHLTYRLTTDGMLHGTFEVGAPGGFIPYLAWSAKKVR